MCATRTSAEHQRTCTSPTPARNSLPQASFRGALGTVSWLFASASGGGTLSLDCILTGRVGTLQLPIARALTSLLAPLFMALVLMALFAVPWHKARARLVSKSDTAAFAVDGSESGIPALENGGGSSLSRAGSAEAKAVAAAALAAIKSRGRRGSMKPGAGRTPTAVLLRRKVGVEPPKQKALCCDRSAAVLESSCLQCWAFTHANNPLVKVALPPARTISNRSWAWSP